MKGQWIRQLGEMKTCRSTAELVERFGPPPHKVSESGMEIWHYPMGAEGGMLYSIHVAVTGETPAQTYMHMEPAPTATPVATTTSTRKPWWRVW